jgi:mycoredoxin
VENTKKQTEITVYALDWCRDCWGAKNFLDAHGIEHTWVNIDQNPEARAFVERVNHGMRGVRTMVFPDGSLLVDPTNAELAAKVGIE